MRHVNHVRLDDDSNRTQYVPSRILYDTPTTSAIDTLATTICHLVSETFIEKTTKLCLGDHFLFWNDHSSEIPIHGRLDTVRPQRLCLQKDGYHGAQAPPDHLWSHRLWVAGSIEFVADLNVDQLATCTEDIAEIKTDRADACKVTVRRCICQSNEVKLIEHRSLLYTTRDYSPPSPRRSTEVYGDLLVEVTPSTTTLFRYSALTSNAHRIHYDIDYARNIEKYPGLLLQGSLTVTLVLRSLPDLGAPVSRCDYRMLSPCFAGETLQVCIKSADRKKQKVRVYGKGSGELKLTMSIDHMLN